MRLIDADEMLDNEQIAYIKAQSSKTISALTMQVNKAVHAKIQMLIADTPTVEAKPVVKGEWIKRDTILKEYYKCSLCGNAEDYRKNFCSSCGADMRGKNDGRT